MDAALAGLMGAIVGAIASFAGTAITNWFLLRKERESREAQGRIEAAKWRREQVRDTLLNAAFQLDLYVNRWLEHGKRMERAQQDQETVRLSAEVKRSIVALLMHFPDHSVEEYARLEQATRKANHTALVLEDEAWDLRQSLIALALRYQSQVSQLIT